MNKDQMRNTASNMIVAMVADGRDMRGYAMELMMSYRYDDETKFRTGICVRIGEVYRKWCDEPGN